MKKLRFTAFAIAFVTVLCSCSAKNVLGNINHNFSEAETSASNFTFIANSGDKIKFSFRTEIETTLSHFLIFAILQ